MSTSAEIQVWNGEERSQGASTAPALTPAQLQLRQMVLDSVTSPHCRRNYAKALDLLFAFAGGRPLTRALLLEYRSSMEDLAPSTVNVRLAAVRKMVTEAKRNGLLSAAEASNLTDVPNIRQSGKRLGNWLTKEQARELLAVPDRSTVKGKRDYAILALLVGCALRRRELASLTVEAIQMRENRWVIADLRGEGGRVRTVAVPVWVKQAVNAWQAAGKVEGGPLLRAIAKGGKVRESLSDWAIWSVVTDAAKAIGIERFGAHDLRRTCAKLCRKAGAIWSRSSSCWALVDPDNGALPGFRAGDRRRCQRQPGTVEFWLAPVLEKPGSHFPTARLLGKRGKCRRGNVFCRPALWACPLLEKGGESRGRNSTFGAQPASGAGGRRMRVQGETAQGSPCRAFCAGLS